MTFQEIAKEYGLDSEEEIIFNEYVKNRFAGAAELEENDTSFLLVWERIIDYAGLFGAAKAINEKVCPKHPVDFHSPDSVSIEMYESCAGRIPVIYVRDANDFEQLVTNIVYKGVRPDGIGTTGASFIHGKTTRFIILSEKPYSNVPASELSLSDENVWRERSLILRRGHECTHYFTKQTYGITNNILHDELMADFIGMYEAFGFYRAEWFLRFMGIIEGRGKRFLFYTKELPEKVKRAVAKTVELAAESLMKWSETDSFNDMNLSDRIKHMCMAGINGMIQDI